MMSYPHADAWREIIPLVTQEVLDNATICLANVQFRLSVNGINVNAREPKTLLRIAAKTKEVRVRDAQFFKVVSDFVAFRIHCSVTEILREITKLTAFISTAGGTMWFKGNFTAMDKKDGTIIYTDIVQYVYAYAHDVCEHIMEFQIGSSFASYTFSVDSALRDDPNCGLVDMWTADTYNIVKDYLLNKANGMKNNFPHRTDAYECVFRLFPTGDDVPAELRKVLDELD